MTVDEFLEETKHQRIRGRVTCTDGWSISIQASSGHYCSPRKEDLTDTVYGWVPMEIIEAIVAKHGGIIHFKQRGK